MVSHQFRLYVAGSSVNSVQAIANLQALCLELLPGRHRIEVIDILREPGRALADGILLTPALKRLTPLPVRTIVGNLSEREAVLQALGLSVRV
ncbi:MAG: circadian clock KaiB family protein [Gemmatimonadota bacterium]